MDTRRLGSIVTAIGVIGLVFCIDWWLIFYSSIIANMQGGIANAVPCLIYTTGVCFVAKTSGAAVGYFAYEPFVFWLFAVVIAAGIVIHVSSVTSFSSQDYKTLTSTASMAGIILILGVTLAFAAGRGYSTIEQIAYFIKMIVGWTAWTGFVAIVYAGLEKLLPGLLCTPPSDESSAPRADGV